MNTRVILLLAVAGIIQSVSASKNPECSKLPDVKKFRGNESCCELPALLEQKAMEECWKEASSTSDSPAVKDCKTMECLFKRHNFLKADGSIDRAAGEKYLNEKLQGNEEWLEVVKTTVDQCMRAVEDDYDKMMQFFQANHMKMAKPDECAMKPTLVSLCVSAKSFAKCPEKSWNQSQSCSEWKKYMATCTDSIENTLEFYKQLDKSV